MQGWSIKPITFTFIKKISLILNLSSSFQFLEVHIEKTTLSVETLADRNFREWGETKNFKDRSVMPYIFELCLNLILQYYLLHNISNYLWFWNVSTWYRIFELIYSVLTQTFVDWACRIFRGTNLGNLRKFKKVFYTFKVAKSKKYTRSHTNF